MVRTLKAKNTGVNWYTEKTITVMDKVYNIVDSHFYQLEDIWILTVKAV